jgi:hypothetical protein
MALFERKCKERGGACVLMPPACVNRETDRPHASEYAGRDSAVRSR